MKNNKLSHIVKTNTIVLILLFIKTSYCQDLPDSLNGSIDKPVNEIFSISFETTLNGDDVMIGLLPGLHLQNLNLTAGALFLIRPYKKKILVERSTNFLPVSGMADCIWYHTGKKN